MSSTPNYGFKSQLHVDLCAVHAIDREIRRIEDKVDMNSEDLANTYSISEMDCRLDKKADKCAFEKHLMDPHAHQELFDQKVDKKDGCRLICEDELQGIYDSLEDRYTKDKVYTQEEVDELLAKKANNIKLEANDIQLAEGIKSADKSWYCKTQEGLVIVYASVQKEDASAFVGPVVIGSLPEGYRPISAMTTLAMLSGSNRRFMTTAHLHINTEGSIYVTSLDTSDAYYIGSEVICFIAQ